MSPITHLLDTHAWIWFFNRDPRASKLIEALPVDCRLGISAITVWEAAMLEIKGRVQFHPDLQTQVRAMLGRNLCMLLPLLPKIAIASTRLKDFHNDLADRIIVTTAQHAEATLVTADAKIITWAVTVGGLTVLPF